jgi:8-oxo-dGTP diphosphatase
MFRKQNIARLLRNQRWIVPTAHIIYRFTQPFYTAGVVGVVFNDADQLLIVEHVYHPKHPWGLPGGWIGRREDPAQTAAREVREETNMQIQVLQPLVVQRADYMFRHLDVAYLCYAPASEAAKITLSDELLQYRWVSLAEAATVPMWRFHQQAIGLAGLVRLKN